MSHLIVPLETPQSRRFDKKKKKKNKMIFRCQLKELDFSIYSSVSPEQMAAILDKVLSYDNPTQ